MRFMLIQNYGGVEGDCAPMSQWEPSEVAGHIAFQIGLNTELRTNGELVDAQGLAAPAEARFVVSAGADCEPRVGGDEPSGRELIAGYRIVDVVSIERAIEIAARVSAAPGQGGRAIEQRIEVRQVMQAPEPPQASAG